MNEASQSDSTKKEPAVDLEKLQVAQPCPISWQSMKSVPSDGLDRVRFCGQCKKNVYNLSSMTRGEIESLIIEKEGKLCVSFFRRRDGTILTEDCPYLQKIAHRAVRRLAVVAASLISTIFAFLPARAQLPQVNWGKPLTGQPGDNFYTGKDQRHTLGQIYCPTKGIRVVDEPSYLANAYKRYSQRIRAQIIRTADKKPKKGLFIVVIGRDGSLIGYRLQKPSGVKKVDELFGPDFKGVDLGKFPEQMEGESRSVRIYLKELFPNKPIKQPPSYLYHYNQRDRSTKGDRFWEKQPDIDNPLLERKERD